MLKNFSDFPLNKKTVYLRAIQSVGLEHELLTHLLDKELEEKVSSSPLLSLSGLNPLLIKQGNEIDYLWVSFFATGQTSYIRQVLENLNRDDRLLKLADDLGDKESETYIENFINAFLSLSEGDQLQFLIASHALFTMTIYARADQHLEKTIQEMIKEEDSLNFLKKINLNEF